MQLGYKNISVVSSEKHESAESSFENDNDQLEQRRLPSWLNIEAFITAVTARLESGELWESETESCFHYWEPDRTLQGVAKVELGKGWKDRSASFERFADPTRCRTLKGRYGIVSPSLDLATKRALQKLTGHSTLKATLFTGCAGTSTALHYDRTKNFFFQLKGKRRFILLPPGELQVLYLPPTGHPYHRHSLLEPWDLRAIDWSRYPRFQRTAKHSILVADLGPGDILMIPPFWSHFVVSLSDDSLGLASRLPLEMAIADGLTAIPIPFETEWSAVLKRRAMRAYLGLLLQGNEDREIALRDRWIYALNETRPYAMDACDTASTDSDEPSLHLLVHEKFPKYAAMVWSTLHRLMTSSALREHLILDYCDDVVLTVFSPFEAVRFMVDDYPRLPSVLT